MRRWTNISANTARIDYLPKLGIQLQIWERGDRDGNSVRITIPILESPRNVCHAEGEKDYQYSTFATIAEIPDYCSVHNPFAIRERGIVKTIAYPSNNALQGEVSLVPSVANRIRSTLNLGDSQDQKLRPRPFEIDLIAEGINLNKPFCEALHRAWMISDHAQGAELVAKSKGYDEREAVLFAKEFMSKMCSAQEKTNAQYECGGAKYKPVAKKVVPVSVHDPDSIVPEYKPIKLGEVPPLPINPPKMKDIAYTSKLTKERVDMIIRNIPNGFLTKEELELLIQVVFMNEKVFAFKDDERGTFSSEYYPDYVMRTVPHEPWQAKLMKLPHTKVNHVMELLEEQKRAGKYELSSSSYRSAIFAVEKKNGDLQLVHDLQPLNKVTI